MKKIIRLMLFLTMCVVLCSCTNTSSNSNDSNEKTSDDLVSYILENGTETNLNIPYENVNCITVSESRYDLSVYSSEGNDTYDKVAVEYVKPDKGYDHYRQLIIDINTFDFEYNHRTDYAEDNIYRDFEFKTYYQLKANAKEYTNETKCDVVQIDYKSGEINEDTSMFYEGMNKGIRTTLDSVDSLLVEIGFSIKTLGFDSYVVGLGSEEDEDDDTQEVDYDPGIGMTKSEVTNSTWGEPDKKNIDEFEWGTEEQWVYDGKGYIYFENDVVTAIQHR